MRMRKPTAQHQSMLTTVLKILAKGPSSGFPQSCTPQPIQNLSARTYPSLETYVPCAAPQFPQ